MLQPVPQRSRLLLLATLALAPALAGQAVQVTAPPGPIERKIDPAIAEQLDSSSAPGRLRVVVELRTQPGDARFDSPTQRASVEDVATSVLVKQSAFLDDLDATTDLTRSGAFELIDLLTLQYSVVGYVSGRQALDALAARDEVRFLWLDRLNKPFTIEGRNLTGSTAAAAAGNDGAGVGVAVIDSHFDLLHPELGGSTSLPNSVVRGGQNFSDPGTSIHSQQFGDCYHGTGTASIVRRYAPGVDLYCHTVFPNAFDSVIANSINWCVTNKNGTGGGAPIRIISMSLGGGRNFSECNSGTLHTAAGNAVTNGILVFAASGNDGWTNSMGSPACSSNVISVGSVWDENNAVYSPFPPANCSDTSRSVNERTCYSDTASFLDLYAPSEEVFCASCGGGIARLGGTSSACPAAAGLTAQLLDHDPSLIGNKSGVLSLYQSTGVQVIGDSSKRRIDLTAAIGSGGGGGGGATPLANGTPLAYSVATGGTTAFTLAIPANATSLDVSMTGSGDADLYVKRATINWPVDQGAHSEAEFKAPYIGGSSESTSFTNPAQDTWNVLIHGYSGNPSGTITANWEVASGAAQWNYVGWVRQTPHSYGNNQTYTHTYSYPGATSIAVHFTTLNTEASYDFLRVYDQGNQVVFQVSGNLISNGTGNAFSRTDGWAIVSGSSLRVELTTDGSVTRYGYLTDQAAAYY